MSTIYGIFADPDAAQRAVNLLTSAGPRLHFQKKEILVVSGEPYDGYDFSDEHAHTHLFRLALLGAAIGGTLGYLLVTFTQRTYPIPTGGMPLSPSWTNGIIVYEMTMLGATLSTILTLLVSARLPQIKRGLTDPVIWEGGILVGVPAPSAGGASTGEARAEVESCLRQAGAISVKEFPAVAEPK